MLTWFEYIYFPDDILACYTPVEELYPAPSGRHPPPGKQTEEWGQGRHQGLETSQAVGSGRP